MNLYHDELVLSSTERLIILLLQKKLQIYSEGYGIKRSEAILDYLKGEVCRILQHLAV